MWTSSGITAGIDLALAMVAADSGEPVARATARKLVVYHRRPGGQFQFSELSKLEGGSNGIGRVLAAVRGKLSEPPFSEQMAEIAGMSPRQFARVFQAETGCTPAKAVKRLREETERLRLEQGAGKLDRIARRQASWMPTACGAPSSGLRATHLRRSGELRRE